MRKFPEVATWLTIGVRRSTNGKYEHLLAKENSGTRAAILPRLRLLVAEAHEDARRRLQRLATGSLDPLADTGGRDPAQGYPELLHIQTLKGYFGEILAGVVAENLQPFGMDDWVVPAHLFRYHLVEFQQLAMMDQTGQPAALRPGRTGDDCLAFRCREGRIVGTLFCEAKCTADHDPGMIGDAHGKSSLPNLLPVDLLQLIEVLEESPYVAAARWVGALRRLHLEGTSSGGYERLDHVTYVCGRAPVQEGRECWISEEKPHDKYTAGRRLHVAEIQLGDVERLITDVYSGR